MLRVIGAGISSSGSEGDGEQVKAEAINYHDEYKNSTLCTHENAVVESTLENYSSTSIQSKGDKVDQFATSYITQIRECYWRTQRVYFRSPEYTAIRIILSLVIGVFLGGIYFQLGFESRYKVQSQIGIIYLAMDMIGIVSMVLVVPTTFRERDVFYRETASAYYAKWVHGLTIILVEIPYILLTVALYVFPSYWMIGLDQAAGSFFFYYFGWVLFLMITTLEGVFLSFALPSASVTQVFIGIVTGVFNIFSGFLLPRRSVPNYLMGFYYVNHDTYVLNTLSIDQFGKCQYTFDQVMSNPELGASSVSCNPVLDANRTVAGFVKDMYDFDASRQYIDVAVLCTWIPAVMIGTILSAQFISYIKR
mmetsp:Transcript_10376/g.16931  ORF Transcript_10376/g.16931 Transcript_10376/m.16931 type:complete len:364 (+) Transcript_10376:1922-3013(+)